MARLGLYVLDSDRNPIPCEDVLLWGRFFTAIDNRRVAFDEIAPGVTISTVFLGIDHSFSADRPVLFETMWFTDYGDSGQQRYETWAEAESGHREVVSVLRERITSKSWSSQ